MQLQEFYEDHDTKQCLLIVMNKRLLAWKKQLNDFSLNQSECREMKVTSVMPQMFVLKQAELLMRHPGDNNSLPYR